MLDNLATGRDKQTAWQQERERLVKLCARITGDASVAEDLAQEALLEGWRHQHTLREPDHFSAWLSGVARNVSLRWLRQHSRIVAHTATVSLDADDEQMDALGRLEDTLDVGVELERKELAALLDQALSLLPDETRTAFLAHVVEGMPVGQISTRLGMNASTVTMRLHRGKLILRRALTGKLGRELAAYNPSGANEAWEDTPLWCTICGTHRLRGRYHREQGELWLRCPTCNVNPGDNQVHTNSLDIFGGAKGYKRAYNKLVAWVDGYYQAALRTRTVACIRCGRATPLHNRLPEDTRDSASDPWYGLLHECPSCNRDCWESLAGLMLATPVGHRFYTRHGRIRTLPFYAVEAGGRQAVIARFESVTCRSRLVMTTDAETFELLRVDGGSL
ncbi:MAG TPA: RNA polymerase sigma factor [Ktedonobacterales bacterium]|jgi:RNA polymerase sigma-70 factor (ECF subfamily)|nr:RNA polymerase sigma factor [Ktedonobacterales bacterium]